MKNKFLLGAFALLSVFTMSMTSCSDDDKPVESSIEINNAKFGHDGEATIGSDMHLEANIITNAKIKLIEVEMTKADGTQVMTKKYDTGKYVGVLAATFHEHIDIPKTLAEGTYKVFLKVTDMENKQKVVSGDVKLIIKTAKVSVDILDKATHKPITSAKAGDKVIVKATVASLDAAKPVTEMELEFHGSGEWEVELEEAVLAKYIGKSNFTFEEEITVPEKAVKGKCHFHYTVEVAGHENTAEIEDFEIK